jgi:hypothetical protein
MLLVAFFQRWNHQGRFGMGGWLLPMLVVVSWYPLFAALKEEALLWVVQVALESGLQSRALGE